MRARTQSESSAGDQSVVWISVIVVGMLKVVSFWICFKGRTIKPSPQIKCTERKRGFEEDSKGLGLRQHNRDVPVWKGAGNPPPFLLLIARISSFKCVSVDSVGRETKLRWSYLVTAGRD